MRIKYLLFYLWCITVFNSCTKNTYNTSVNGFQQLQSDLIEKFGEESYFTDLKITLNNEKELEVNLLVTNHPYSYKMEGWSYKNGYWKKVTEVDLELTQGDILNYLYTIDKEVNIVKIGYLVNLCIQRTKEKGYSNVALNNIAIISPNDGNKSKMAYTIVVSSNNETVSYTYSLQGDLTNEYTL